MDPCGRCENNSTKYCRECDEKLCESCSTSHQKGKATKNHILMENVASSSGHLCDVCQLNDKRKEATSVCVECDEKLCPQCKDIHERQKATRTHVIDELNAGTSIQATIKTCDICREEGLQNDAIAFCTECEEYLCSSCESHHKRQKATKAHTIIPPTEATVVDWCEPCLEGQEKTEACKYCSVCDEKLCALCSEMHPKQKATRGHKLTDIKDGKYESRVFMCDVCTAETAIEFCEQCEENLCQSCSKLHRRQKATRQHVMSKTMKPKSIARGSTTYDPASLHERREASESLERGPRPGTSGGDTYTRRHHESEVNENASDDLERDAGVKQGQWKPGKPKVVSSSPHMLLLTWEEPKQKYKNYEYRIYSKKVSNVSKRAMWQVYEVDTDRRQSNIAEIKHLKASTTYKFKIEQIDCDCDDDDNEEITESEISDPITTKQSPAYKYLDCTRVIENSKSATETRCLLFEEDTEARNEAKRTRKLFFGGLDDSYVPERNILLVGESGSGKSAMADRLINYLFGVDWEDPFRFKLGNLEIDERDKSQTKSQTTWITTYSIARLDGGKINFRLNIIDTPGYGDTKGEERDREITEQIQALFSANDCTGISSLDAICFIIKASANRLTRNQTYIFDSFKSIFGNNVKEIFTILTTFSTHDDEQANTIKALLKSVDLPYKNTFPFENSAEGKLAEHYWELGNEEMKKVFCHIGKLKSVSLTQTVTVLETRRETEDVVKEVIKTLDDNVKMCKDLEENEKKVQMFEKGMSDTKNFNVVDYVEETVTVGLSNTNALVCPVCKVTCHDKCTVFMRGLMWTCEKMQAGYCTVCRCKKDKHLLRSFKYEKTSVKVERTNEDLKRQYGENEKGATNCTKYIIENKAKKVALEDKITDNLNRLKQCQKKLQEYSMKKLQNTDLLSFIEANIHEENRGESMKHIKDFVRRKNINID